MSLKDYTERLLGSLTDKERDILDARFGRQRSDNPLVAAKHEAERRIRAKFQERYGSFLKCGACGAFSGGGHPACTGSSCVCGGYYQVAAYAALASSRGVRASELSTKRLLHSAAHAGASMSAAPTLLDMMPDAMPRGWRSIPAPPTSLRGALWYEFNDIVVCVSLDVFAVGGTWLHTSCSVRGQRRLPTWEELSMVKQAVHEDRLVVQVLPPRSAYVNIAEVLHLWERIDAPTLPDDVWRR